MNLKQIGFFDEKQRLEVLTKLQDPLETLKKYIQFDLFLPLLEKVFQKESKSKAGRPPKDIILMFKILLLQRLYNLSDEQTEYQINDRISFGRFLDISMGEKVPDFTTIWRYREALVKGEVIKEIFEMFAAMLQEQGVITKEGSIIDATIVEVPKQRNTRQENEIIKNCRVPEDWKDQPKKLSQKDTDARWTKKNGKSYYGYKDHIKADKQSKIITQYEVTPASTHDNQVLERFIKEEDKKKDWYADSAYKSKEIDKKLEQAEIENKIQEKGKRGKPLGVVEKIYNRTKSKIRARVEHIFGYWENSMNGKYIRTIGIARAKAIIGLVNLAYNMKRYLQLIAMELVPKP